MQRYTVAVLVRNQFGVLNRVTSMFRRRRFNIDSLTVSETETADYSRNTDQAAAGQPALQAAGRLLHPGAGGRKLHQL